MSPSVVSAFAVCLLATQAPKPPEVAGVVGVRAACTPETDAACVDDVPHTAPPVVPPSRRWARAQTVEHMLKFAMPHDESRWTFTRQDMQSMVGPCAPAGAGALWRPRTEALSWLKVRLGQVDTLEPQHCASAPTICVGGCN